MGLRQVAGKAKRMDKPLGLATTLTVRKRADGTMWLRVGCRGEAGSYCLSLDEAQIKSLIEAVDRVENSDKPIQFCRHWDLEGLAG